MEPGTPLWQVVPTRDADGRPLADFMMLVPRLNKCPRHIIDITLLNLQQALEQYHDVVFANFNLKINVLWVSVNCQAWNYSTDGRINTARCRRHCVESIV